MATLISHSLTSHLMAGLVIRLIMVSYGYYQDMNSVVPYTDVDYHVISDAAKHVINGNSPFLRATYRYSPIFAFLMVPNIALHETVGKFIFCCLDLLTAVIINKILTHLKCSNEDSIASSLLWLYNPLVIGISTRGSPESVILVLVLLVVYFHVKCNPICTGLFLGLAVHTKIYPIIYSLPLYLSMEPLSKKHWINQFYPTKKRVALCFSFVLSFCILTGGAYYAYGYEYIKEGFLYHVTRTDTRHNFSIYFYLLYLSVEYNISGLNLVTFVPQFVVVFMYGLVYGLDQKKFIAGIFAQTVAFVTFNKVVTSQYFLWYGVLIPLLYPSLKKNMSKKHSLGLLIIWLLAQASWLFPAYLFEFEGMNVFLAIWLEGVAFFSCNIGVLVSILSKYEPLENIFNKLE